MLSRSGSAATTASHGRGSEPLLAVASSPWRAGAVEGDSLRPPKLEKPTVPGKSHRSQRGDLPARALP